MRHIAYLKIVETVKMLCYKGGIRAAALMYCRLALQKAAKKESNPLAAKILQQLS